MTDPAQLRRTHLFRYGEAYDDLRSAFFIDERGYVDVASARRDVDAAEAALRRLGVIFEIEVSESGVVCGRDGAPSWEEFRQRHFVDGTPLPVRPPPADQALPPSWHDMLEEMVRAGMRLCDELRLTHRRALPGGHTDVVAHRGPTRQGPASVYLHEQRFGFTVAVETELDTVPPDEAMAAAAEAYEIAGWQLGTPTVRDATVSCDGERDLFLVHLSTEPGLLSAHVRSPLYGAPAEAGSTWATYPRTT